MRAEKELWQGVKAKERLLIAFSFFFLGLMLYFEPLIQDITLPSTGNFHLKPPQGSIERLTQGLGKN